MLKLLFGLAADLCYELQSKMSLCVLATLRQCHFEMYNVVDCAMPPCTLFSFNQKTFNTHKLSGRYQIRIFQWPGLENQKIKSVTVVSCFYERHVQSSYPLLSFPALTGVTHINEFQILKGKSN